MISLTRSQLVLVAVPLVVLLAVAGSRLAGVGVNETAVTGEGLKVDEGRSEPR